MQAEPWTGKWSSVDRVHLGATVGSDRQMTWRRLDFFFFKGVYRLHKIEFKIILFCFSYIRISRAYCSRISGIWSCHIALAVVDCVLMLTFSSRVVSGASKPPEKQGRFVSK